MKGFIFDNLTGISRGGVSAPKLERYWDTQENNIVKVTNVLRRSWFAVNNNNPLVGLLARLRQYTDPEPRNTHRAIMDDELRICAAFNINTYAQAQGTSSTSIFNTGCKEILVSISSQPPSGTNRGIVRGWEELSPITILDHPFSDTFVGPLEDMDGSGWIVVGIDIAMLATQYDSWVNSLDPELEVVPTMQEYLATYPLANTMRSIEHIKGKNRILDELVQKENPWFRTNNSFSGLSYCATIDVEERLLQETNIHVTEVTKTGRDWTYYLNNLQIAKGAKLDSLVGQLDTYVTQQNRWLLLYLELSIWYLLLQINSENTPVNNAYRDRIRKIFRSAKKDRTLDRIGDSELEKQMYVKMNEIEELLLL